MQRVTIDTIHIGVIGIGGWSIDCFNPLLHYVNVAHLRGQNWPK